MCDIIELIKYHAEKHSDYQAADAQYINVKRYDSFWMHLMEEYEETRRKLVLAQPKINEELKAIKNHKMMLFTNILSQLSKGNKILVNKLFMNLRQQRYIKQYVETDINYDFGF